MYDNINSVQDFGAFLKERSSLEERHAQSLKRLSRSTHETIRRPESKGGSFASNFEDMTRVHERMADNGLQFSNALYQMHDELQELTSKCERDRKHWKQTGLDAEKRVQDAESAMNKAKGKYNSLADSYDRARTGEKTSGKFGIGNKSEEDIQPKLVAADNDYASKVQMAQGSRRDLISTHRPAAVHGLEDSIKECDAGLTLQLSKYAALSEKMLLGNGLCVSPLRSQAAGASKSLREIAQSVDNHKDFHDYVMSFSAKAGTRQPEIKYEKHPALGPQQQRPNQQPPPSQSFDTSQPQYGTPERTNTYDSQQQGHRPSHSGQVSGVMPYQPTGGSSMSPNQPGQSVPPQLPQIGSFGGESGPASDFRSPVDSRGGPPPFSGSTSYGASPTTSHPTGGYGSGPTNDSVGGYGSGPNTSARTAGYGAGPASTTTMAGYGQGPMSSAPISDHGHGQAPSSTLPGQGLEPRGASESVDHGAGAPSQSAMARPGFSQDVRGSSNNNNLLSNATGSRGPSFGQPSDVQGPSQSSNLRPQGPENPSGSAYNQKAYRPVSPGAQGAGYRSGSPGPQGGGYRGISGPVGAAALPSNQRRQNTGGQNLPPLRPVFGVSLDELFNRDGTAVPSIVYQCVQAVDLFGLDTEGIYRTSGSAPHIMELKAQFDHGKTINPVSVSHTNRPSDSTQVDFRNPSAFHHDIASVTTLLKHFFRDLPDPLLTSAAYTQFIAAAKIDDDHQRRDSLHAIINALPDPNYATLRVIALHLYRVSTHSEKNRMTPANLAICLGPTIMGQGSPAGSSAVGSGNGAQDIKDAGWQARVVETILNNTMQIFDDDE